MIDQRLRVGWGQEDVDVWKTAQQFGRRFDADHAPHQGYGHIGPALLEGLERPQLADRLLFRALAHDAGVDNDDIGLVGVVGGQVTRRSKPAATCPLSATFIWQPKV